MYGRSDRHAFSHFGWKLENRVRYMRSGFFVEQAVFAFAGGNMKLVFTYHIVKFVSVNAGGIDDDLRLKGFRCIRVGVDGL